MNLNCVYLLTNIKLLWSHGGNNKQYYLSNLETCCKTEKYNFTTEEITKTLNMIHLISNNHINELFHETESESESETEHSDVIIQSDRVDDTDSINSDSTIEVDN